MSGIDFDNREPKGHNASKSGADTAPRVNARADYRSWTRRYSGALVYEIGTDRVRNKIVIKAIKTGDQLDDAGGFSQIMAGFMQVAGLFPSGLKREDDSVNGGETWTLPNDAEGRGLAMIIENELERHNELHKQRSR
jgi:hypothetical protein